ncbi:uncharacterized protein LOC131648728 [Vicia villosa]|uniref:uncharacterized protein LOC131648728 n=1 Tax=Vicia villosa TaxID=3911 RepID=UPI00273B5F74|nr:uncharacterized protein LOC131648728 [Vicia villosa]
MNCTLWEDYAKQFFKFNEDQATTSGPTLVLLQYAKVKKQGQYPLSVTNTFHVTKLHINADLPSIKDFINSFPKESLYTVSSQLSSQSQCYSRTSTSDIVGQTQTHKLLKGDVALPLSQIKKLREKTFYATVAKTKKLIAFSYEWYYQCFHVCTKAARDEKPLFECDAGHFTEAEIYKYDWFNTCVFDRYNLSKECTEILQLSAAQMRGIMIQVGITDPLEFPLALDGMLDLKLAFRVKWQPSWDSCSVIMLFKDRPLKEGVDEAKTDAADDCDIVTVFNI